MKRQGVLVDTTRSGVPRIRLSEKSPSRLDAVDGGLWDSVADDGITVVPRFR